MSRFTSQPDSDSSGVSSLTNQPQPEHCASAKPVTPKAAVGFAVTAPGTSSTLSLTDKAHAATTPPATSSARKSRKRLTRRTGQGPRVTFYFTKDGRRMGRIIYWTDVAGQAERVQRSKSLGDLTDLSAEQIEKKRKKAIAELGIYKPAVDNIPSPDSFAEKAADWMETEMLKNRDSYNQRYHVTSFLLPAFGKLPLDCVTADVVNAWLGKVKRSNGERYGKNTLKHAVSTLKQIVSPRLDNANIKYSPRRSHGRIDIPHREQHAIRVVEHSRRRVATHAGTCETIEEGEAARRSLRILFATPLQRELLHPIWHVI
jgi:hypothetical protein